MDLDPRNVLNLLHEYLGDENTGPQECHQLLTNLNDVLIQEQLNLSYLDLCLKHMFNQSNGLLNFVTNIVNKKSFKSSVITVLEIIYTLINNFPVKLEKHVITAHEICLKVIKSSLTTSDEKVKSLEVLSLSFEKIDKCLENPDHYNEIYNNLRTSITIKKSDSVQEKVFKALGTFAKHFQYLVKDPENLRILFLSQLEIQMIQKEFSYKVVSGLFSGLDQLCENYPFDLNAKEDKVIIGKLYRYVDKMAVPAATIKVANRAALTFLANNISLFVNLMTEKFRQWHETLLKWLTYGPDDQKVGVLVVGAFYQGLGEFLLNDVDRKYRNITLYFVEYFQRILKDNKVSNHEKRLCLLGLSSFSAAFYVQLSEEEMKDIHVLIMHTFEETYVFNQEHSSDALEYLPNYTQTVAKFIHLKKITNNELFCLQKGVILMIKTFPQLSYSYHGAVVDALVSTFHCLSSNDENIFNSFVENTIYQGVVWSCSHQHISEAEILEGNSEKVITVKNYLNLWKQLLRISPVRKYDKCGIFLYDRKYILTKVIDKLVRTMLILINKLNVSVVLTETNAPVTDIESAYKVSESNDFAIFLNVVDFYQEVFTEIEPTLLKKCICKLIHHLLAKCVKYPLISGFYKLLSFCLKTCNKLNYFEETNINSIQDVQTCYQSLTKFIEIILNKTKQFKGDLLIACLQVLLEYPTLIIRRMLSACVPSFRTIFQVGRSYIKLADMAIDTLEYWQQEIAAEEMEPFLAQIIPLLDSYLQSKSFGGLSQINLAENRRKTSQALKRRKVLVEIEPELIKLQKRMLHFIGQQSSSLLQAFVTSESHIDLAVWGDQHHLKVTLPYEDIKLDIYLDKVLPRIINLALNSTDRKTRVIACELLQAIMMVFLGTTKQMTLSTLSDLNELLKHVAFPLLKLGCDLDQVVEQLFRPLFFQLIHWYTHATQRRSDHSAIIIEAVMEGITHPTDTALRDFSGKCVNEFVKWTIKQTDESNLAQDPLHIKVLLKKMRFYSVHPDPFKKLGAALIFNNIYREVREELPLLSMFWIEFLHVFIKSLSLYESDADDENCVIQINNALTHIERGFVEKSNLFNKSDRNRRVPIDIKGDLLEDVCVWVLAQTGSESPYCREKCMELFCNITPYTKGYKDLQNFITKKVNKNTVWIKDTYELFLIQYPTLHSLAGSENILDPMKWMQAFLCALDGYKFVVKNNLAPSQNVLSDTIVNAIRYFIEKISAVSLDGALALINPKQWIFTTFEKHNFDKQKSQAVRKMLHLFNVLLNDDHFSDHVTVFYTSDLWNLLLNIIFNRHILGFESFIHYEDDSELIESLESFMKNLPEDKIIELAKVLDDYVTSNFFTDVDFKSNVELKHRNIIKGLTVLQSFNLSQLNSERFTKGIISALLNKLISGADNELIYADDLQDTTLNYCLSIFDFALSNGNELKSLIEFLYKPYQVQTLDNNQPVHFGSYIFTVFEESVLDKIIENFEVFLNFGTNRNNSLGHTVELIIHVLNYMVNRRQLRKYYESVVKNLLDNWAIFEKYFNENFVNTEMGIGFVQRLFPIMKMCKIKHENLKKWLISLLTYEQNLSWKNELDLKISIFYLLVDIMDVEDDENVDFRSNLLHMKNKFFSNTSSLPLEIKITSVDKLFCTTPKIRTPELLKFVLDIYARIPTEKSNTDAKNLLKEYILKNNEDIQEKSLSKIYELCHNKDIDDIQRYKLITNIVSLFQYCNTSVFETFFIANISKIFSTLKESVNQTNLIERILQLILLEILFLRCPISSTDTEISPISEAALPKNANNKTFILHLLKFTLDAFKDSPEISSCFEELFRLYKCHAYNTMVSIVSNSLKDANFYTKLFVRQENNKDILWASLIDTKKSYVFETDFDTIPKRKKILVNIRDEVRARRKLEDSQLQTVKYIESMRVYNSSLCEDLTKFDFTNTIVRNQSDDLQDGNKTHVQSEIELDCTDVNTHECMANVCGLIDHIVRTGIIELPDRDDDDYTLPVWMKGIRSLLLSEETHENVKIFWVKVIDNTMHIFKHFAKWFFEPLLKFVVDKCAGTSINYFITDVISILASWSTDVIPREDSEVQLASELLIFFISQLNNERQDMFKYHLELIRLLVEAWKTSLKIPHDLIYSKLNVDVTSRKVEVGIHVSSILLANNIAPWESNNIQEFCKPLFNIVMRNKYRSAYKPCSETIGLLLRFLEGHQYFTKIFGNVHLLLKKIEELDKYAHILEALVIHYPPVADEFNLNRLLSKIHAVPRDLKVIYLKIILNRSDVMSTISDFKTEKWDSYVENDNLEVQLLSLEMIYKCLNALIESDQFKSLIKSVCKHVSNPNVLCRDRMYDIAIIISKNESAEEDNKYEEVYDSCKSVLIQGVIDNDAEIREKVLNFWQTSANLPEQISKRFSHILTNFYKTNTENDFLGYSSYLLLDVIKNKEEYNNVLFEHPLEDCDFEDYHLETNWRVRHMSVVPLFAETLQTFSEDPEFVSRTNLNKLRQTQASLEFEPTQSVRMKQFTQYTASESSLFIKSEEDTSFVNPNLVSMSYKYRVPKRRFLRDKSKIHKYFAQQEVKKSVKKIEHRKDLAKERENKVTIYRNYRKGDLPDVQIALQAILEPLQVLTLHDSELSKILYLEIYKSILSKMGSDRDFMGQIASSIKFIFDNSVQFNRNLFRALLDALMLSKNSIIIQPDLIASVSQSSGLTTLGVLLLEEYLISYDDDPVDSKRTKGYQVKTEISYWVKLAELYKEMDEWDVVKSIFLEKMDCRESVKEALLAESEKQWRDAQNLYKNLIETDETLERKDFYYESYFKCFAHLGEWDNLVKSIDIVASNSENGSWDDLWDHNWNQQKLLPWYINGQLKNALFNRNVPNQFFVDLNRSLNSENAEYLQNHFSEELAMLWIFKREPDEAEQYLNTYINNFLNYWQLLDPLYTKLRFNKLMKLRNVVDINKFMDVIQHFNVDSHIKIRDLINYWNRTANESLPSILLCEEKVLYRRQFVNLLTKKIESYEENDLQDLISELNEVKFKQDECLINTGIEQNNFYMTKKYLTTYNNKNILKLKLSLSKVAIIKSRMLNRSDKQLELLLEASRILAPIFESGDQRLKILASVQLFTNLEQISSLLREDDELFHNKRSDIVKLIDNNSISSSKDVVEHGVQKLKLFLNNYENELHAKMECELQNDLKECETVANAYVKLAYFAKAQGKKCFTDFMFFVLRAMKFNSSEGRQLFPCILMEQDFTEQNKALFIEETGKIPLWMFLGWIPQLLVNIDSSKVSAVAPVVLKIAETYPQAIMYAYRLSKENYTFKNDSHINDAKTLIAKLGELLLNDEGIDKFLKALSFIGVPAAILLYYVRKMIKTCQANDSEGAKIIQENILSEVFDSKPDSRDVKAMQGNMFKKTEKYKKDIQNLTRSKNADKVKSLKKIDGDLVKILRDPNEAKKNSRLLKDYCPWLANFSANKINVELEIPGQYDGKRMPLTQHHIKISGFCPSVSVMSSLRKPIKITILGNDTKEYPFLVKFGEDVRQDQRIQQLFSLMNNIFENDKTLNEREFSILTYEVVPLTTNLGIIQWIDNTTSLQDFVKRSLKDAKSLKSFDSVYDVYQKWIYKSTNIQIDAYGLAAVNYSRDKTIPKFRSMVSLIQWDILRLAFLKLSANTEGFSALRNNFIKSYAIMCVSHWILGVGDRHLSNSLICLKNGKVLGIDFGHAFGTATQILPVPELVPFRLTPHIVSLMEPLGERGLFRETMVHCLRSLRLNTGSLLATMNVFIEEPSLDWLEHASKFGDADPLNCEWYPAQKVAQAKRKLEGANSTTIMCEDLTAGHQRNQRYLKAYHSLVKGVPEHDIRARKEGDNLSVEDQVDCLIDHATDYNLLGRMFEGWAPWV